MVSPRPVPVLAVRCWRHAGWSLRMRRQTDGTYVVEFELDAAGWHAIPGDHATPNKARIAGNAWAVTARESLQERVMVQ